VFSESGRRNIVLGAVAVILLIVACAVTVQLYKSNVPEHVDRNTINVTQSDYDQALQKWTARGVSEYEISIHSGADDITLRVSGGVDTIQVLQHLHSGSPANEQRLPAGAALLRRMTVDLLFQNVKEALDFNALGGGSNRPGSNDVYFFDYSARFNPDLGYPTYFSAYQRATKASREIVWRETIQAPIEVTNLKIIR
jgi:hypothetical protein